MMRNPLFVFVRFFPAVFSREYSRSPRGNEPPTARARVDGMSTYENLLTPGTCVGSDDGNSMSPGAARRRRGWSPGLLHKKHSSSPRLTPPKTTSGVASCVGADVVKKRPKSSNVIKRAIHKIAKKTTKRRHSYSLSSSPAAAGVVTAPKVCPLCYEICRLCTLQLALTSTRVH